VFEEAGIASVVITVWKELIEQVKPPRALVVAGQFGSPMGKPGDTCHQLSVLRQAVRMLDEVETGGTITNMVGDR
jgi:hypothetical protein